MRMHDLAQVEVYLDDFISIYQGGPTERRQMLRHLFRSINTVFWKNVATDVLRKEPTSTKKLGKGDASWLTNKPVLGWELDKKEHRLRLTPKRDIKVRVALDAIPAEVYQVSLQKWRHLIGLLRNITLSVDMAHGMFTRLQHALQ